MDRGVLRINDNNKKHNEQIRHKRGGLIHFNAVRTLRYFIT